MRFYILLTISLFNLGVEGGEHENYCKDLLDYGPREEQSEDRLNCRTVLKTVCEDITAKDCLEVCEQSYEVSLVPDCKFTTVDLEELRTSPELANVTLHNCSKEEVRELHTMTVYECENVTKTHCTTLWELDENGDKVWAGNDGDCKDITWEECSPVSKEVPVMVPTMNCEDYPVDLVNSTPFSKL